METYSGKILEPGDYEEIPVETEDYSTVLFRMGDKIHGSCTTCQTMAGRKNRLYFEIAGSKAMVAWDSEKCNELWIGSREGANQTLIRDASLSTPSRGLHQLPRRAQRGLCRQHEAPHDSHLRRYHKSQRGQPRHL